MSARAIIQSYYLIIERLRSEPKPTKKDLLNHLSKEGLVNSARSLERRLEEIRDEFKLEVVYDPKTRTYSLNDIPEDDLYKIMKFLELNAFIGMVEGNALQYLSFSTGVSTKGYEHIRTLLNACQSKIRINFKYSPFVSECKEVQSFCPVLLREYLGRWYILGFFNDKEQLFTYALDRITILYTTNETFITGDINYMAAFDSVLGIVKKQPEIIELAFSASQAKYLKTQPWHKSQEIVSETENEIIFRFYLSPNYELIQRILSQGPEVMVIKPESLAKEVKRNLELMIEQYQ